LSFLWGSVVINITESASSSFERKLDESSFDIPRAALRNTTSFREFRRAYWEIVIHVPKNNDQAGCAEFSYRLNVNAKNYDFITVGKPVSENLDY
jgi:hypothetical protein